MADNPLSNYLDELLTPAASPEADWDSLLAEAVEPHRHSEDNSQPYEFSDSTLEAGYEPVLALKQEHLNSHQSFSQLLLNLTLVRQLPSSRLRQCILTSCSQTLDHFHQSGLGLNSLSKTSQVICYD